MLSRDDPRERNRLPQRKRELGFVAIIRAEQIYEGRIRAAPAFTVAAPRRLNGGVQPRLLAVNHGKVHVHTRLDQAGRNHATGQTALQPVTNLLKFAPAVRRRHQRGKVIVSLAG